MKTTHYLIRHPKKLVQIIMNLFDCPKTASKAIKIMAKYCSYDKRIRSNYEQDFEKLLH